MNILMGGDKNAIDVFPTVVNSVIKNTDKFVNFVILCRGWIRDNITTEKYSVEFIEYYGHKDNPNYKQSSANDIIYFLPMMWGCNRCLVLGWDQLVVDNIDEYYDTEFQDSEMICAVKYDNTKLIDLWKWKGKDKKLRERVDEIRAERDENKKK